MKPGECYEDHFNYDLQLFWAFNSVADIDFVPVTVEETEETILQRDRTVPRAGTNCTTANV